MPIVTKERYFGEGIYESGEADPHEAFKKHRESVRIKRLDDLLGKDAKLETRHISPKFDQIKAAIEAADKQVFADNAEFMKVHGIKKG